MTQSRGMRRLIVVLHKYGLGYPFFFSRVRFCSSGRAGESGPMPRRAYVSSSSKVRLCAYASKLSCALPSCITKAVPNQAVLRIPQGDETWSPLRLWLLL